MPPSSSSASIQRTPFGTAHGQGVDLYTLTNRGGASVAVMNCGAAITALRVPDRRGAMADIVLGFDDLAGYLKNDPFFGVIVGRVANRIRDGRCVIAGKDYRLAANDPPHHLHGGPQGWDKAVWQAEALEAQEGPAVRLRLRSPDGDAGYPGNVDAEVVYALDEAANQLRVAMRATTDATTLVNMAQHSYFNLAGEGEGTILDHELTMPASAYTPGDPMVPTGEIRAVDGTPFDFRAPKPVGRDLKATGGNPVGYDHNFVVDGAPAALRLVARVKDPRSGRVMTLEADQPGVQLYTGNFLNGTLVGKRGRPYQQHTGLCLETQRFPNAVNVPAWRDQVVLHPGQVYAHQMIYRFTAE
jgi:aldose 1-epimerase